MEDPVFISYQGRNFEVPHSTLNSLITPDIEKCADRLISDRGSSQLMGCAMCDHYSFTPVIEVFNTRKAVFHQIDGELGILVEGCKFSRRDLRYTLNFTSKADGGKTYDAWVTPCAVLDAVYEALALKGKLDAYEVCERKAFADVREVVLNKGIANAQPHKIGTKPARGTWSRWNLIMRGLLR